MRGTQIRLFFCSGAFGLFGWAVGEIVDPLDWLPWVTAPLTVAVMAVCAVWWLADLIRERTRKALPGLGAYMAIQINQATRGVRRYIFQIGDQNSQGVAIYLSASEKLVFVVRDTRGEPYTIELPLGRKGFPIGEPVYLGAEAGQDGNATIMRVIVDGRIMSERRLPFRIEFGEANLANSTIGANHDGNEHGDFSLARFVLTKQTLADKHTRGMAHLMLELARTEGPGVIFGSQGTPTWMSTRPDS